MNILVTGANGQLGNEFRMLSSWNITHKWFFTDIDELDITNYTAVRTFVSENKIDCIINCAAYTNVDNAESDKELATKVNVLAVENLAMVADLFNASFITVSTDYVFDGENCIPYIESDKTNPKTVYGSTKRDGEERALSLCKRTIIIRTAWLYSEFGNNFVKTMIRLGQEKDSINVVFDQIGSPTWARGLAGVIIMLVDKIKDEEEGIWGIYHYSDEGVCSWYDFAREIMEIKGLECEVLPIKSNEYRTPANRPHYSVLDKSKIKKVLNIKIPHWSENLERCIEKMEGN